MNQVRTYGRMELAQVYFPVHDQRSTWRKLKSLLLDNPATVHLAQISRRIFLPVEVSAIYAVLGEP